MACVVSDFPLERYDSFYDDPVVFLVENVLFRTPLRPFAHESEGFRNMFELPVPEGSVVDGSSDEHPLHLEGVSSSDFRYFLRVLFPPTPTALTYDVSIGGDRQDEWIVVLKLSTMWLCDNIRKIAIGKLSGIVNDPVERIVLSGEYNILEWLVPSLIALAKRGNALEKADAEKLGLEYVWKVAKVRESYLFPNACACSCYECVKGHGYPLSDKALAPLSEFDLTSTICGVFDIDRSGKPAPKISHRGAY